MDQSTIVQNFATTLRLRRRPRERMAAAVVRLARQVWARETAELARLLADSGDVRAADIAFVQPELVHWRTDGGGGVGTLSQIRSYYEKLDRGRLALVAPAGAGKTVLAVKLVCDLAATLCGDDVAAAIAKDPQQRRVLTPVRLSAPAFNVADPASDAASASAYEVAARLDAWLTQQLAATYGVPWAQAKVLVEEGWILPVLDGVDEMDPPRQPPTRAGALLAALNRPGQTGLRSVVITCRDDRYGLLSTGRSGRTDVVHGLQDATVMAVQPLDAKAVFEYLSHRFPDPRREGEGDPRWRGVLARVHADCVDDPLAQAMHSPLRVFMAVAGYRAPDSRPEELMAPVSAAEIDELLFAKFVPAVTAEHPAPDGRHYAATDVTRWLATLAKHLDWQSRHGRSGTDLLVTDLWVAGGLWVRWLSAAIITAGTALTSLYVLSMVLSGDGSLTSITAFLMMGGAFLMVLSAATVSTRYESTLSRFDLRTLKLREARRRVLWGMFSIALVLSFIAWLYWMSDGFFEPSLLVAFFVWGVFVLVLKSQPVAVDRPGRVVTQGLTHDVIMLLAGAALGIFLCLRLEPPRIDAHLLAFGVAAGLMAISGSPWIRYFIASAILRSTGKLPPRPARFLDWAHEAGLVRMVGIWVQFRHREFQAWLTRSTEREVH